MSGVTDIKLPSVGKIVDMVYATLTPAEKNMFDGSCGRFQLRPAMMVRRQINDIRLSYPDIDAYNRTSLLQVARTRQFIGLSIILDNISRFELFELHRAIERANAILDADK